ncbi:MAG: hypothetical protein ACREIR_08445 [Geminicoccaceae bacterium]
MRASFFGEHHAGWNHTRITALSQVDHPPNLATAGLDAALRGAL